MLEPLKKKRRIGPAKTVADLQFVDLLLFVHPSHTDSPTEENHEEKTKEPKFGDENEEKESLHEKHKDPASSIIKSTNPQQNNKNLHVFQNDEGDFLQRMSRLGGKWIPKPVFCFLSNDSNDNNNPNHHHSNSSPASSLFYTSPASSHSCIINHDDQLPLTFGYNEFGQLGNGKTLNVHPEKAKNSFVLFNENFQNPDIVRVTEHDEFKVKDVALGYRHSLILTENGKLYVFGENAEGQLGIPDTTKNTLIPQKNKFFEENGIKISQIYATSFSSFVISDDGKTFYAFGKGEDGVLGVGDQNKRMLPQKINFFPFLKNENGNEEENDSIQKFAPGSSFVLCLTKKHRLFVWGNNFIGQLGLGHKDNVLKPQENKFFSKKSKISNIFAGTTFAFVLCENNELYGFGGNDSNQLSMGMFNEIDHYTVPTRITFFDCPKRSIAHISCGWFFTHFLTTTGELFSCGLNWYGQLGVGHDNNIENGYPEKVEIFSDTNQKLGSNLQKKRIPKKIIKVSCGFAHTLILTEDRVLYHVGQADGGNNIKPLAIYEFK